MRMVKKKECPTQKSHPREKEKENYTKSNSYDCINHMRLKSELYAKEQEEIVNKIVTILDLENKKTVS